MKKYLIILDLPEFLMDTVYRNNSCIDEPERNQKFS